MKVNQIMYRINFLLALLVVSIASSALFVESAQGQSNRRQRNNADIRGGNSTRNEVRDHRKNPGNIAPPIARPPSRGPSAGYAGPFNGATRIEVLESGPTAIVGGNWKNVGDLNLPGTLDTAWLVIRGMVKNELTFFFEKGPRDHRDRETLESIAGRNLYDLSITMSDGGNATTLLTVPGNGNSVTLQYRVPGNKLKFRAEVDNFFDPTITIETTMTISLTLQPSGDPQQPLKVANASIEFSDTKASVDGNVIHNLVKNFVEFVKGTDFERKIAQTVNGRRQDITNEAAKGINLINRKLTPYSTQGATALKFEWDRKNYCLVLKMSSPRPVLSRN
jgi:hypothetical protein